MFHRIFPARYFSTVRAAWREKLSQGPSLKSFIEQTIPQASNETNLPSYLTENDLHDSESFDPLKHPKRRVYFDVYGCQMNENDTDIAYTFLNKHGGYERVQNENDADIVLLMTCSIREGAEQKIWKKLQSLGHRKRTRSPYAPPFQVGVLGCMAERLKEKLIEREKIVDVVCGPDAYRALPNLLDQTLLMSDQKGINTLLSMEETYADVTPLRFDTNNRRAFVSIMRGCNNICTFCIVPFTRGRERSRPMSSILEELRYLVDLGIKDVTLLGQNVNSYCDKSEMNVSLHTTKALSRGFKENYKTNVTKASIRFATLLDQASQISPELRIRFTSPHPKDFPDDLLHIMHDRSNICKSIHLPCQSGSTRMLELMRRGYTKEAYLSLVEHIRSIVPNVAFSSDFIAGFCSETEDDHRDTLEVIDRVGYNFIYSFPYSMREKTKAHYHLIDDIPSEIKSRRHLEIHQLFRHHANLVNQSHIGQVQLCLVEGPSKRAPESEVAGRNDYNTRVIFSKQIADANETIQVGDYVAVRIDSGTSQSLKGTPLKRTTLKDFQTLTNLSYKSDKMLESIGSTLPLTSTYFTSLNLVDCRLLERFERAGIKNLTDLSLYSPLELSLKFRLSISQSEEILKSLFSTLSIQPKTAFDLLIETTSSYIPTKLPTLNQYLNGGLRRGSLIELCGSWGSGKTQFCLHLTAQCCLMGLRSIYIDSEHTFSPMRLLNMIGGFDSQREQLLELVRTETVFDSESLLNTLTMIENELEEYVQNNTVDQLPILLIIDSIAAPLRMTMTNYNRENILLLFTDCAKRLARKYNLLILVTNQVTTKRRSNVLSEKTNEHHGNDFYMSVALGKAWSYSVNVRLAISYRGDKRRELIIGKSIESPGYTIAFQILTDGIEEIDQEQNQHTQRKSFNHQAIPRLIQADEMQLIGKQLRP